MATKRILYILHSYYNRAGTEEHTRALCSGLGEGFECFIASPDGARIILLAGDKETASFAVPPVPWPVTPYRSAPHEEALDAILQTVKPDLIHIQHSMQWPLGILDMLIKTGLPVVMSFHDYYPITPDFTMRGIARTDDAITPQYSHALFGEDISQYLFERQAIFRESLVKMKECIVPSQYLGTLLQRVFQREFIVRPHGIEPFSVKPKTASGQIRYGYVGSLLPQKGYQSLLKGYEIARKKGLTGSLTIFGAGAHADTAPRDGVTFKGAFLREDLGHITSQLDVGILPSEFAETFSLVLSELWYAGCPVAAARIGVFPERIEDGINGKLFPPGDPSSIADTLLWFQENPAWKEWRSPKVKMIHEMLEEYRTLYRRI